MIRLFSLLGFAALVAGLFLAPDVHPVRMAARQVGELLREPALVEGDWRRELGPGDRVETSGGVEALVVGWDRRQVVLQPDRGETLTVDPASLARLVQRRPLWRFLTEGPAATTDDQGRLVVKIQGYRMLVVDKLQPDFFLGYVSFLSVARTLRTIAAEEGLELVIEERASRELRGALLRGLLDERGTLELGMEFHDDTVARARKDWRPPNARSLLPPLVAILLAILFRRPVLALFAGVLTGSVLHSHTAGLEALPSLGHGLANVFTRYFRDQLVDPFRQQLILFVVFMLAMVGVITRAGGIRGLMDHIAGLAKDLRRTQIATWLMGLVVFFDDYANTILVGTTMRPLSDRFRVAREKLAYIVDSTAAPVAGISVFSTWIAFEVSTFSAQLPEAGLLPTDGYTIFLETLPYRFYCLFTLMFVGLVVVSGRDFGPMLRAESRARGGKLLREGATPMVGEAATRLEPDPKVQPAARVALIPLGVFVLGTLAWMLVAGGAFSGQVDLTRLEGWKDVLGAGGGAQPLMYGSLAGLLVAALLAWTQGLGAGIAGAAWTSLRSMGIAFAILYLAWMIGATCADLGTAAYLTDLVGDSLEPHLLPLILFLLAGLVAFSTGSSWSTMSILLPLVVGLAFQMGGDTPLGPRGMLVVCIGAVLEGSIFGDHCSPISDTTVMSSIASASDHIDHVRTQMPYALTTMGVALLVGYFPAAFVGLSPFASLALGAAVLAAILWRYGRRASPAPGPIAATGDQPAAEKGTA